MKFILDAKLDVITLNYYEKFSSDKFIYFQNAEIKITKRASVNSHSRNMLLEFLDMCM